MVMEWNVMRFNAEVARVDEAMVSSDFLGVVKMYRPLLWPLVAVCQHLGAENYYVLLRKFVSVILQR